MQSKLKRVALSLAALTAASSGLVLSSTTVNAAGTFAGPATLSPTSGGLTTNYTLNPPANSFCAGDSAAGGYDVRTFMTNQDPTTLTWSGAGPATASGFTQPLFTDTGSPITGVNTAPAAPGAVTGRILALGNLRFEALGAGTIPDGAYTLGIACVKDNQTDTFYTTQVTFANDNWSFGAPIAASPTIGAVAVTGEPGSQVLTVPFGAVNATPAVTSYDVVATLRGGVATTVNVLGAGPGQAVFNGLAPGIYDVQARAKRTGSDGPLSAIPVDPAPGSGGYVISAAVPDGTLIDGVAPGAVAPKVTEGEGVTLTVPVVPGSALEIEFRSTPVLLGFVVDDECDPAVLAASPGQLPDEQCTTPGVIQVTVTVPAGASLGNHAIVVIGPSNFVLTFNVEVAPAVLTPSPLIQEVIVEVPVGVITFTQTCGRFGTFIGAAAPAGIPGFEGGWPAAASANTGNGYGPAPEFRGIGACNILMSDPVLVEDGDATVAGAYYQAVGSMNQVTVIDSRDTDSGWLASGKLLGDFQSLGDSFSGNYLGWYPQVTDTSNTADGYTQTVAPGDPVLPGQGIAGGTTGGITSASTLAVTPTPTMTTGGIGRADLDARMAMYIPLAGSDPGEYTATLELTLLPLP